MVLLVLRPPPPTSGRASDREQAREVKRKSCGDSWPGQNLDRKLALQSHPSAPSLNP